MLGAFTRNRCANERLWPPYNSLLLRAVRWNSLYPVGLDTRMKFVRLFKKKLCRYYELTIKLTLKHIRIISLLHLLKVYCLSNLSYRSNARKSVMDVSCRRPCHWYKNILISVSLSHDVSFQLNWAIFSGLVVFCSFLIELEKKTLLCINEIQNSFRNANRINKKLS